MIFAVVAGCRRSQIDLFPPSGVTAGWQKTSETRVFPAKDLWRYIDGDADRYLKAGVISAATSDYKYREQLSAVVDVYTMSDSAGARKILDGDRSSSTRGVPLGDEGIAFEQSIAFRKGSRFVRIVSFERMPDSEQALLALAHGVEGKL